MPATGRCVPSVRIGRVILARREWILDTTDLAGVTAAVRETQKGKAPPAERRQKIAAAVAALRDARKLPRFLMIAAGDTELPVDLDNPLLAAAFADEVSGLPGVELVEMFPAPDKLIAKGPEGRFANELVLTFTRAREPSKAAPAPAPAPTIRRTFTPGSEWLYAKIYCGESTGDRVLREAVAGVVRGALEAGDADRWFFIRYSDPDPHIRVRMRGDPARLAATVLPALDGVVAPLLASGAARKVVLDTYQRETERYGGDRGIELVEELFWHDSEAVLGIVELLDGDAGGDARWRLALRGIDSMLEAVGLDSETRMRVVSNGRDMIGREYNADAAFWGRLGDRFKTESA